MSITAAEATKLDSAIPEFQAEKLGTALKAVQDIGDYDPILISLNITADATGGQAFTIPYAFELMEVVVQSRATSASGTVQIFSGASAITNVIVMETDTAMTRAATLDDSKTTILKTSTITAVTHGAGDKGLVCLIGYRA